MIMQTKRPFVVLPPNRRSQLGARLDRVHRHVVGFAGRLRSAQAGRDYVRGRAGDVRIMADDAEPITVPNVPIKGHGPRFIGSGSI
jgi:hypothetical protein